MSRLRGLERVVRNLKAEIGKIERKALVALVKGAILIRRDMDHVSPLIPVDLGNLRASFFTVTSKGTIQRGKSPKFKDNRGDAGILESGHQRSISTHKGRISGRQPRVCLGFSAYYAVFVHEMEGDINWKRPGSGPKFLQAAFNNNIPKIRALVRKEVRI